MKLGKTALIEIIAIVANGLATGEDISEGLRQLDLGPRNGWENVTRSPDTLELTMEYVREHPRESDWDDETEVN